MNKLNSFFWKFVAVFCLLFVVTFVLEYSIIPEIYPLINPFFENLIYWSGTVFFRFSNDFTTVISSDSIGLYIHCFNLIFISLLLSFLWEMILKNKPVNLRKYFFSFSTYYLVLQMLIYGFDKVFKAQFYTPEPNVLFTNFGDLSPDILYWSTIGSSWSYSFFLGSVEILVAGLLLFRKTRLLGIILGFGVMVNVIIINFSYDISVKVYASFLLGLFLLNMLPFGKYLYRVLILKKPTEFKEEKPLFNTKNTLVKPVLKTLVILLFLIESLFPFVKSGNYNEDNYERPIFHGAYQVNSENTLNWKQVFIHRRGYFITKNSDNKMQDYHLSVDTINQILNISRYDLKENYTLNYEEEKGNLTRLFGKINNVNIDVFLNVIALEKLPIKQIGFHWTTNH